MSRRQTIIIFGILVIVLPFLGFPSNWQRSLNVTFGAIILVTAIFMNRSGRNGRSDEADSGKAESETFVEHKAGSPDGIINKTSL